jgi:Ca2+-transporting ATPase
MILARATHMATASGMLHVDPAPLLSVNYVPALNGIFKTAPLSPAELAATAAIAAVVFVAVEVEKWVKRRP